MTDSSAPVHIGERAVENIGGVDLTWRAGATAAGGMYLLIGRPSVSPLTTAEQEGRSRSTAGGAPTGAAPRGV